MSRIVSLIALCTAAILLTAASPRYIDFAVRNDTMETRRVRVKDSRCDKSLNDTCRLARDLLRSRECREDASSGKCKRARRVLEKTDCTPGTIYTGDIKAGKSMGLSSCNDGSGHAEVEISLDGGSWTRYSWIDSGATVNVR